MDDPYKILGIDPSATAEEVKKAYFDMAKKYHPDSGDENELKKFHEVAAAYKLLSDEDARKAHDTTVVAKASADASEERKEATYYGPKRETYRDEELKAYHKRRFRKAVFRMLGFTLVLAVFGLVVSLILGGSTIGGVVAGAFIGFSFSINKSFNVRSFFSTDKKHKAFSIFTWFLLALGFGYFVWLIFKDLSPL